MEVKGAIPLSPTMKINGYSMIELAKEDSLKEIMLIFKQYPDIFPHIRSDKVLTQIQNDNVIYQDNVVITFGKYKKRLTLGNVPIQKGAWILHQIVNRNPQNGMSEKILNEFISFIDNDCYLTVRSDNIFARKFYIKHNFTEVGDITWKSGTIPGKIYCYKK